VAVRLVRAFSQRFDVDVTSFRVERHFGPQEPFHPLHWALRLLAQRDRYGFAPLPLSLFVVAARLGRW